jgi:hypothetical protein
MARFFLRRYSDRCWEIPIPLLILKELNVTESKIEKIKAAEVAADQLIKEAQQLREQASTVNGELRDELLRIADGMEQNARLMKEGLVGMRGDIQ